MIGYIKETDILPKIKNKQTQTKGDQMSDREALKRLIKIASSPKELARYLLLEKDIEPTEELVDELAGNMAERCTAPITILGAAAGALTAPNFAAGGSELKMLGHAAGGAIGGGTLGYLIGKLQEGSYNRDVVSAIRGLKNPTQERMADFMRSGDLHEIVGLGRGSNISPDREVIIMLLKQQNIEPTKDLLDAIEERLAVSHTKSLAAIAAIVGALVANNPVAGAAGGAISGAAIGHLANRHKRKELVEKIKGMGGMKSDNVAAILRAKKPGLLEELDNDGFH